MITTIYVEICCCGSLKNILFAIFAGLFGSGMVTVFIYGTEYSVLRKKTLETYWQTAFDINKYFGSIRVMYFGDSIDQVKEKLSKLNNRKAGICLRADYKRNKELESYIEAFRTDVIYHCEREESEYAPQLIATQHWDSQSV